MTARHEMGLGNLNLGCQCCDVCEACTGDLPSSLTLVVTGAVDGFCGACSNFNATWILPIRDPTNKPNTMIDAKPCQYHISSGAFFHVGPTCAVSGTTIHGYFWTDGTNYYLDVHFYLVAFGVAYDEHIFRYDFGTTKPVCISLTSATMTYISSTCGTSPCSCDLSSATVLVTTNP